MGLKSILRGNRQVESGSFPLYRLDLFCGMIASILQVSYGAPASVINTTSPMFDWIFICIQLFGSLVILYALYQKRFGIRDSLKLEQIGCLALLASTASYTTAVIVNNAGPPTAHATWLSISFSLYLAYRVVEIRKLIKRLDKKEVVQE